MRLTEQEFLDLMRKKKVQRLILPFRLPTWNQLLAMNRFQQKKVRDAIKAMAASVVSTSITKESDLQTLTVFRLKQPLTHLYLQDYLLMITPNALSKYRRAKKNQKQKKQSSTSFGCKPDFDNLPFG